MGPRKTIWTTYTPYFKPQVGQFVRVVHKSDRVLSTEMLQWIEENKDKTFKIRAISGDSIALYGVSFSVSVDLLETCLSLED